MFKRNVGYLPNHYLLLIEMIKLFHHLKYDHELLDLTGITPDDIYLATSYVSKLYPIRTFSPNDVPTFLK